MTNVHDGSAAAPPPEPRPRRSPRALEAVAQSCMLIAGICLVVLIAIFGWLVYGRYILNDTPTWVEQAAILFIAWITFLGAAAGVYYNTHLSIDFVREAAPVRVRSVLRVVSDLYVIAFGCFMAWQGWLLVSTNLSRKIPMIGLSESWRAAPLMICGALMVLFAGARAAGGIGRSRAGEE